MKEFVQLLSPDKLMPFSKHPFQVREDESLEELMESIRSGRASTISEAMEDVKKSGNP